MDLKWSVWHCTYCNVSGQNKRLLPEGLFQVRYRTAMINIMIIMTLLATQPYVIVYALDFCKAFDGVRHSSVLNKSEHNELRNLRLLKLLQQWSYMISTSCKNCKNL